MSESDRITFKCVDCGSPVVIDNDNPPRDEDALACHGCGRTFGTFAEVREAMLQKGREIIDKMVGDRFGKKPTWTRE